MQLATVQAESSSKSERIINGRFLLRNKIGSGAFSKVYLGILYLKSTYFDS